MSGTVPATALNLPYTLYKVITSCAGDVDTREVEQPQPRQRPQRKSPPEGGRARNGTKSRRGQFGSGR